MSAPPSALPELVKEGFENLRTQLRADFKSEVADQLKGVEERLEGKFAEQKEDPTPNPNAERVAHLIEAQERSEMSTRQATQMLGGLIRAVGAAGQKAGEGKIKDEYKRLMGGDSLKRLDNLYELDRKFADDLKIEGARAYEIGTPSNGGVFAPEMLMSHVIPMLYASAILSAIGIAPFNMGANVLKWPRETAEGVAYWGRLEPKKILASQGGFGEFRMEARSLTAMTSFTKTFLRATGSAANDIALRRFKRLYSKTMDKGALYEDGQSDRPLGLFSRTSGDNKILWFSQGAAPSAEMPMNMLVKLMEADSTMANLQWVMGPTLYGKFANLKDGNGNWYFPEIRSKNPTLLGFPVRISTTMKVSGASHTPADLILADWDRYLIGEYLPLELFATEEGAYYDATGTIQSTVSNHEMAVRFVWQGDLVPEDGNCFLACNDVWTS